MKRYSVFLIGIFFLTACGFSLGATVTPSSTTIASEIPPVILTHTVTFSPSPPPTVTPTNTAYPTQTLVPSPTLEKPRQEAFSPDGKLVAKLYEDYWHSFYVQAIEIQDMSGEVIWAIPFQGTMQRTDPHSTMMIAGWANDSSALYFYYSWAYDGWYTLFNGCSLQALDVKTRELKDIIDGGCVAFSFFANMNKIAYTQGSQVGVVDIVTGNNQHVDIEEDTIVQSGYIHVSPNESGIVFTVLLDEGGNARIIYLDFASMKQTALQDIFIEDIFLDGWTEAGNPQFLRINRDSDGEGYYELIELDKNTADILNARTPTPKP